MNAPVILPVPYFGPVKFWAMLLSNPAVCTLLAPFKKQDFLNRTIILGPNKIQTLTVPCSLKEKGQTLPDTPVVYREKWPLIHTRSLTAAYGKSPYFEYYWPEIEPIILSGEPNLGSLNLATLRVISRLIKIPVETDNHLQYQYFEEMSEIETQTSMEVYQQVFSERYPFTGNLSILDVLFNLGPETRSYLMRQSAKWPSST